MPAIQTHYLSRVMSLEELKKSLDNLVKALKPHVKKFDTIVFRGVSGAMIGPALALKLKKEMIIVRKSDNSHSIYKGRIEGNLEAKNYLIVDDMICTGCTIKEILSTVEREITNNGMPPPVCVGMAFYHEYGEITARSRMIQFKEEIGQDYFVVNQPIDY
jgi:orotate phosphoribosyltransferase-like protein